MKKTRILSFLLAALMTCAVLGFTGCGDDDKTSSGKSTSTRETQAISMYIITEDTTTKEQADKVEMELNRILLPNYETMIDIHYLTAEEYWQEVEAVMDETDPEKSKEVIMPANVEGLKGKVFTDMIEYIFADSTTSITLDAPQIDILVVDAYDKYLELINDGKLKPLDSYLTYDSKILNTNIHPTFMSAAKVAGQTYGIPNNVPLDAGEYTYLIVNEDMANKYGFELKDLKNYTSPKFEAFLSSVKSGEPGVWPISEPLDVAGAEYYDDAFVAVNGSISTVARSVLPVFGQSDYIANRTATEKYKNAGFFPANPEYASRCAIKIEKSPVLFTEEADKRWTENGTTYVRYLYDIPRVSIDEAFTCVMSVSATSPVPDRAMEIITHFQTNPELANMLQFGIEGDHYQIDKLDGSIAILSDEYAMDTIITGNTYIKYNVENDEEYLEKAIAANLNVAPSTYLGLNDSFTGKTLSEVELAKTVNQVAAQKVEDGEGFTSVYNVVSHENQLLGYVYDSFSNTSAGAFGRILDAFKVSAAPIAKTYSAGADIVTYNDYVLGETTEVEVVVPVLPTEDAEGEDAEGAEAVEGEVTEGEVVDGEATEGETTEGENLEGEAAEAETEEAEEVAE